MPHKPLTLPFSFLLACQCVKLQLDQMGLETEFLPCELQVKDSVWEGIRRKYWHGRDTYYLPRVTWKQRAQQQEDTPQEANEDLKPNAPEETATKRQKIDQS